MRWEHFGEALLQDLYPEHDIVTSIIWTALPEIVIVPPERLRTAIGTLNVSGEEERFT